MAEATEKVVSVVVEAGFRASVGRHYWCRVNRHTQEIGEESLQFSVFIRINRHGWLNDVGGQVLPGMGEGQRVRAGGTMKF